MKRSFDDCEFSGTSTASSKRHITSATHESRSSTSPIWRNPDPLPDSWRNITSSRQSSPVDISGPAELVLRQYIDWHKVRRPSIELTTQFEHAYHVLYAEACTLPLIHQTGLAWLYNNTNGISDAVVQWLAADVKLFRDWLEVKEYFLWQRNRLSTQNDFAMIIGPELDRALDLITTSTVSLEGLAFCGKSWLLNHGILYVVARPVGEDVATYREWKEVRKYLLWMRDNAPASVKTRFDSALTALEKPGAPDFSMELLLAAGEGLRWLWKDRVGFPPDVARLACMEHNLVAFKSWAAVEAS